MFTAIFYRFFENLGACFTKRNILIQALAALVTYVLVVSGLDWQYFEATRGSLIPTVAFSAGLIGFVMPFILSLSLYIIGDVWKNKTLRKSGAAVAQAGVIAISLSSLYKAFTGRAHPDLLAMPPYTDLTHQFSFGFLKTNVFWGWPSSHTTVAFATSIALAYMYPRNKLLTAVALVYAFYIGIGVSVTFHWLSDFVAGAMLGSIIGVTVGKSFYRSLSV